MGKDGLKTFKWLEYELLLNSYYSITWIDNITAE